MCNNNRYGITYRGAVKHKQTNALYTLLQYGVRWKAQLKLLLEVRKEAFKHHVLHLESLLQQYKADLEAGDSTDKDAHAARKDKAKHI